MALHIKVGTILHRRGEQPLDDYVIERIRPFTKDGQKHYALEARTQRQRCFDRALTGFQSFDDCWLRRQIADGVITVHMEGTK
jgi:hypothetical protein